MLAPDALNLSGLRMGVIGPQYDDSFAEQVASAACSLGARVTRLGSAVPRSTNRIRHRALSLAAGAPSVIERWQSRLLPRCRGLDLVVTVEATLLPRIVRRLRTVSSHVVLWFPDSVLNLGRQLPFVSDYSLVCFKEPRLVERAVALLDRPVKLLPEACDPGRHRPPEIEPQVDPSIVVAGNLYAWRASLLERLAATGIPLRLYGPSPPRWLETPLRLLHTGEYLSGTRKAAVFRGAAGVLNTLHPSEIDGVNARLFEATGCGAVTLTENRLMLPSLFEVGKEVIGFSTFDEMVDCCRWALEHTDAGRNIGTAAAERAHRDHTYEQRLASLMQWLGR